MKIERLDHLVMTVHNIEDTCHFYSKVLGMEIVFFGTGRRALSFGNQKINLHEAGSEIKPHAKSPTVGSVDLCLISDSSLAIVMEHLQPFGVKIVEGPVEREGAAGKIRSIYFHDPDGNLIEVAEYVEESKSTTEKKSDTLKLPPPPLPKESKAAEPDAGAAALPPPPSLKTGAPVVVPVGEKQESLLPPPPPLKKS